MESLLISYSILIITEKDAMKSGLALLKSVYLKPFCYTNLGGALMSDLQFFIRHQPKFLQDKFILVFKSNEAKEYFENAITGSRFEEVSSDVAEQAARIGIHGKTIPYGYTLKLTDEEMDRLSTADWNVTANLLAEGNERLYKQAGGNKIE